MLRRLLEENVRLTRELRELRRLQGLTERDELTGLPNRRSWADRLTEELSRSRRLRGRPGCLLIVDMNDLKGLNDRFGRAMGDLALRETARVLRGALRTPDVCCRTGGDEFMILLPETDSAGARPVIARVRAAVMREGASRDLPISVSVGAASWPHDGHEPAELIAAADRALESQKSVERQRHARREAGRPGAVGPVSLTLVK
jgi:diguanylate cyclase (GGDEF)-like protein